MKAKELLENLPRELTAGRVYGEPYERDGVTVIPAVKVRGGGGFGSGPDEIKEGEQAEGGGFGLTAKPAGAFIIKDGEVSWEPAIEMNRVILGGQLIGLVAVLLFGLAAWRRARRRS